MPDLNFNISSPPPAGGARLGSNAPSAPPTQGNDKGVSNSNVPPPAPPFVPGSAPALAPANFAGFNLDLIQMLATSTNADLSNQQASSGVESAKSQGLQKIKLTQEAQKAYDAAKAAQKDAQDAASKQQVLNWVITIAATAVGVGLTVATGGGAAAILPAVLAALPLISMSLQQADVKVASPADGKEESVDVSIPGAINAAIDALEGSGAIIATHEENGKTVDNHGNVVDDAYKAAHPGALIIDDGDLSIARTVLGVAASIAVEGGVAKLATSAARKAASAAEKAAEGGGDAAQLEKISAKSGRMEGVGRKMAIAGGVAQGGATVGSGVVSLKGAEANLSKDSNNTEGKFKEGEQQILTQEMKRKADTAARLASAYADNQKQVSDSIAAQYALSDEIAKINRS
jgi:hypothetical protein